MGVVRLLLRRVGTSGRRSRSGIFTNVPHALSCIPCTEAGYMNDCTRRLKFLRGLIVHEARGSTCTFHTPVHDRYYD